jgi:hypothetical protein
VIKILTTKTATPETFNLWGLQRFSEQAGRIPSIYSQNIIAKNWEDTILMVKEFSLDHERICHDNALCRVLCKQSTFTHGPNREQFEDREMACQNDGYQA